MHIPPQTLTRGPHRHRPFFALIALTLLAGCGVNSDFGEVNPTLVSDGIHDWVGRDAVAPRPPSTFQYTDDERAMRDLAYPLIEPPYDRQRWYSVAGEYGFIRASSRDHGKYAHRLMSDHYRSPSARYAQLIDDIRNDGTRLSQFFETAGRVIDIDRKRQKSLAFVSGLSKPEYVNALRRIRENAHVVSIVRLSLLDRVASYRFALERMVIATPSTQAVEAERSLNHLQAEIARYRTLPPTWVREPSLASSN